MIDSPSLQANLFRHLNADKADLYRQIMDCFAAAKRQFRLHLRPDEVLTEGAWSSLPLASRPRLADIQTALNQLTDWGNLESQPDVSRVTSLSDYYRAQYLYRLSQEGEAVESALVTFAQALHRRAELQTVALEDITYRLQALRALADDADPDAAKVHEVLRDLVRVFESLTDNAQAFMAGIGRSIELQQAQVQAVLGYKKRLIDYLERFIGDLVARSGGIARHLESLTPRIDALLWLTARREARDSAPGNDQEQLSALEHYQHAWHERWTGLRRWFLSTGHEPSQAELLRTKARAAIPQLLMAITALNERRSGRSDRSADFRTLAAWFADCQDDAQAHRLARAAFALNPARHLAQQPPGNQDLPASTPWAQAKPIQVSPRLREYGEAAPRGVLPRIQDRAQARSLLAAQLQEEHDQIETARQRLATGRITRLSELGPLDAPTFALFLDLLGETLTAQPNPDAIVEAQSGDGLLQIRLQPLAADTQASIHTSDGCLSGRDHLIMISRTGPADETR
ncbi:TIGR02677 family protein [Castellaniella sp.]|uniref:TIGR02677 family protein n=1 Tax=Castellaniella sp. TaxID=1955812 RepID=UPI002AFE3191|nr:TIGR02677 family protein [Castellaniella sp.]